MIFFGRLRLKAPPLEVSRWCVRGGWSGLVAPVARSAPSSSAVAGLGDRRGLDDLLDASLEASGYEAVNSGRAVSGACHCD